MSVFGHGLLSETVLAVVCLTCVSEIRLLEGLDVHGVPSTKVWAFWTKHTYERGGMRVRKAPQPRTCRKGDVVC